MSKKILIYGENIIGALPQLLSVELAKRGYSVVFFDFTDILPGIKNRSYLERIKRRMFLEFYTTRIRSNFLQTVKDFSPDIVIVSKGLHLDVQTLEVVRRRNIPLINWNCDDFFNMKNSSESLIEAMAYYDLIISSREHLFQKYIDRGARKILYLDWYYVPHLHFDRFLAKTIPASFVGSWSPYREAFINEISIALEIWGGGWEKSSRSFKKRHNVHNSILSQVEMGTVFCKTQCNLNILTRENSDHSNLRFFEVPASGGLLVTERNLFAEKYLEDRRECLMYSSVEELNNILAGDFDFQSIAKAGSSRITAGAHSFSDRVDEVMLFIECQL
jgi:spore maturation protein CgeB